MNEAASDARKTAVPATSRGSPNRPIGVRISSSSPRGVPMIIGAVSFVGNNPGAIAFTVTPWCANSIASTRVNAATAPLLAV